MTKSDSTHQQERDSAGARTAHRMNGSVTSAAESSPPGSRQLLTVDQLSEWLQVPKQTVYKWRSCGSGPRGLRIGKHVRFEVAEVERWLSDQLESS